MQHPTPDTATRPLPLPRPETSDGDPRRVGIEVECGGLTERELAEILARTLGGHLRQTGDYEYKVEDTPLGGFEVLYDTAFRDGAKSQLARMGLDLGRAVIPVEFVTDPILPDQIAEVDRLCRALREAGATGTRDGIFLGFGVHLNVAIAGPEGDDLMPTLRAYALLEGWLRHADPIDPARRALPFVDPYPEKLVDRLAEPGAAGWTLPDLAGVYLTLSPSRNHGLDLLPILMELVPELVEARLRDCSSIKGRPAWHYRLPDSRIDDPQWSLAYEWNRWRLVEQVGADADLLEALSEAWRSHRARLLPLGHAWHETVDEILAGTGPAPGLAAGAGA